MRVLLVGYYGMRNVGDDALLACAAWGTRRLFPGAHLRVTASSLPVLRDPGSIVAAYPARQRIRGEYRMRRIVEALRARAIVFGGGSNFHSTRDIDSYRRLVELSGPGPHIAAGVSLGPFDGSAAERACARLLRRLDFVGLRDAESFEIARALVPTAQAEKTFDLAVLLPFTAPSEVPVRDPHTVGFALCDYERFVGGDSRTDQRRRSLIRDTIARLDASLVHRVVFLDFNGHSDHGDRSIHLDVASALPKGIAAHHLPYGPDPAVFLAQVRQLGAMVAMRLHAAVLAYIAETPCILLAYHPKCHGWAAQVGMSASSVHESAAFDPAVVAGQVHAALTQGIPPPVLPLAVAQERALENFPPLR